MSLPRAVYAELESVVGSRNISDMEYILAGIRAQTPEIPFAHPSPDAILLPGSVEEVAEIVKICEAIFASANDGSAWKEIGR